MCACDWNFRCERCREAPWEKLLKEGEEQSAEEKAQAAADRLWRETQGFGMIGRAW